MYVEDKDIVFKTNQSCFVYRVAAIIIKDNRLLMAKHEDYPCYYTVGGKVRINETSEEAVIRESYEETGIEFEIDRLSFIQERFFQIAGKHHHEIVFFYLMKYIDGINILDATYTDQGEKEILQWIPIDELEHINIVPNFLKTNLTKINENIIHIISKE
ncbi:MULTISPECIES: NUDIX hydrolase [Clostridium]|uniref:NUDIX hydrolase n=1 Tax=Clostridium TaxID=1485 RepID=UPI0007BFE33A|nr:MULTISPECIES: NUDIX domain-containing protein [Clostridium]